VSFSSVCYIDSWAAGLFKNYWLFRLKATLHISIKIRMLVTQSMANLIMKMDERLRYVPRQSLTNRHQLIVSDNIVIPIAQNRRLV